MTLIRGRTRLFGVGALALFLATGIGSGLSQNLVVARQAADTPHPAHIHTGTCAELGDVVAPLSDVTAPSTDVLGEHVGAESAIPVESSITTIAMPFADIVASPHAINIHASAENIQEYIACGNIGGIATLDTLVIGLGELTDEEGDQGYTGVAILTGLGDETIVSVYLVQDALAEPIPADGAAADDDATANAVAVTIKDFSFQPDATDIAVGDTVTWTNEDPAPHTATGQGGSFQSGRLNTGESFSHTFDAAGTFEYFCEFHPNMHGTIVVS